MGNVQVGNTLGGNVLVGGNVQVGNVLGGKYPSVR